MMKQLCNFKNEISLLFFGIALMFIMFGLYLPSIIMFLLTCIIHFADFSVVNTNEELYIIKEEEIKNENQK